MFTSLSWTTICLDVKSLDERQLIDQIADI